MGNTKNDMATTTKKVLSLTALGILCMLSCAFFTEALKDALYELLLTGEQVAILLKLVVKIILFFAGAVVSFFMMLHTYKNT